MDDIVDRLRRDSDAVACIGPDGLPGVRAMMEAERRGEAADEIERLRRENDTLRTFIRTNTRDFLRLLEEVVYG